MITVGVVGLGVIGGSIALAADRAGFSVVGWDADRATREEAGQRGVAVSTDLSDADLVVLAAPLPALTDTLSATLAQVRISGTATVTDVGSLKGAVAAAMRLAGLADRYVGGHPMAGSDRSGLRSATDDLFVGSRWVLCLDADTNLESWFIAAQFAIDLGAVVVPLTSGQHDDSVALISGVPHLLALALAAAARTAGPYTQALTAGSFADLTRVAGSSPTLLRAVTEQNGPAVRAALRTVLDQLDRPWSDLIEDGHEARQQLRDSSESQRRSDHRMQTATDARSLLELGRAGAVIEAVDPATGVIGYRQAGPSTCGIAV